MLSVRVIIPPCVVSVVHLLSEYVLGKYETLEEETDERTFIENPVPLDNAG